MPGRCPVCSPLRDRGAPCPCMVGAQQHHRDVVVERVPYEQGESVRIACDCGATWWLSVIKAGPVLTGGKA